MRSGNTLYTPTSTPSPTCLAAKPCSRPSKSQMSSLLISPKDRAFLWSLVRSTSASRYPVVHLKTRIGDFEEIYGAEHTDEDEPQAGKWDAILTCFFIDTVRPPVHAHRRSDTHDCHRPKTSSTIFVSCTASLHLAASGSISVVYCFIFN